MKSPVIILPDRVFDRVVLFNSDGLRCTEFSTLEEAQNFIKHLPRLREVPINSKEGQRILRLVGSYRTKI